MSFAKDSNKKERRCPNAVNRGGFCVEADEYFYDVICDLVDKYCLVEHGEASDCEIYMDWLKEDSYATATP